jgi:hypothetical protein
MDAPEAQEVIRRLTALAQPSAPFQLTVDQACGLLDAICGLIRIDDGWDWDLDALKDAVRHLASTHRDRAQRDRVICLYTLNSRIHKWKDAAKSDPQRAPYTPATESAVRRAAEGSPSLAFYHNLGNIEQDWNGSPFVWPVLFVPDGVAPTVFANNRRIAPRRRRRR